MPSFVRLGLSFAVLTSILAGCSSSPESTESESDSSLISDAQTMTQNPDGTFDVVCKDGRTEKSVPKEVILANQVCASPYAGKAISGHATLTYFTSERFGYGDGCRTTGGGGGPFSEEYDVSIAVDANNVAKLTLTSRGGRGLVSQSLQCAAFPDDSCKDMTSFTLGGRLVPFQNGAFWMASGNHVSVGPEGASNWYNWAIEARPSFATFAIDIHRSRGDCSLGTEQYEFKLVMDGSPMFAW